jgi:DNA polymerase-3 subunit alpha
MPDIDIDFCVEGRENVINYIKDMYGHDSVSQIITFGTMKAKSSLRDVGRVLGLSYGEVDRIAKMVPDEIGITLKQAEKKNPDLAKVSEIDDIHKELIDYSKVLEGMHRHASTHAAGVVISPGPLTDYVPLYKQPSTGDIATQVEMTGLEDLGLLKLDFLGLRNLTVIDKACTMINQNHGKDIDIEKIDLTVKEVFDLFAQGRTVGIFQFESAGMQEYLKQLKPTCIEDLIAMNALYRPGPMANIPEFIARKHGESKVDFMHPKLEPILKETNGIIVYQEQVMQISQVIGGFTLAQGDMMRRAMGKKKASLMATFKIDFVDGAVKQDIDKKKAVEIFELLEKFAQYGFNKSHSTAYAIVAYQTAWLKAFYPAEFMSANMTSVIDKTDDVVKLIHETRDIGIEVLPPDVNSSYAEFRPTKSGQIAYGLSAVKNVGTKAAQIIAEQRDSNGAYNNIFDLCKFEGNVNRKVLESLVQVGACDGLEGHRAQQFEVIDIAIKYGQKYVEEKNSSQASLFGGTDGEIEGVAMPTLPSVNEWTPEDCLIREKDLIGFYLSGDPLEQFYDDLKEFSNVNMLDLPKKLPEKIKIGGIITNVNQRFDKKNRPWAIVSVDGMEGRAEIFVFNESFEKCRSQLTLDSKVFIIGSPSNRADDSDVLKFIGTDFFPLDQVRHKMSRAINVRFPHPSANESLIEELKNLAETHKGQCHLVIHLITSKGNSQRVRASRIRVTSAQEFVKKLRTSFGNSNVWIST